MIKAIIPGSFDPMTVGHVDIIERAAKIFDKVYVAIVINAEKHGMFSFAERKAIAEASCAHIPNVTVLTADGMLSDLAEALGCKVIVKGVRNGTDFDYEQTLAGVNRALKPDIETILLPCAPSLSYICSAFARELVKYDKRLEEAIAPAAVTLIKNGFRTEE